jgi:cell division septum initiation protein DivIVA
MQATAAPAPPPAEGTQAAQAAAAAQTPQTAPTPTVTVSVPGVGVLTGVPTTAAEVQALRAKRSELSNQLESAASRRARLSASLDDKEGADRAGIEARIGVLDKRIMQLEADIAETGRQLTMAPTALVASTGSSRDFRIDSSVAPVLFVLFVLAPIALSAARLMWKRARVQAKAALAGSPDDSRRLERLEQGMDAIAIEVERISEGQRFVTRLLSDAHDAPPIPVSQRIGDGARVASESGEAAGRSGT